GQRQSMADGTGITTYGYDALDRVITTTTGAGQTLGYGYNTVGNLTTLTYPAGTVVTRTYDVLDRLSTVQDWLGHTTHLSYDAAATLTLQPYPNGTTATFGYDAADRLIGILDRTGSSVLWSFGYTRDAAGQLTTSSDPLEALTHTYQYDLHNHLVGDQQPGG